MAVWLINNKKIFYYQEKEIKRVTSKGSDRILFGGNVTYETSEKKHLYDFHQECQTKYNYKLQNTYDIYNKCLNE